MQTSSSEAARRRPRSRLGRRAVVAMLAVCMLLPPIDVLQAQHSQQVASQLLATLSRPGDLTLRDTPLPEALFTIGQIWRINVVVGQDVQGSVTGSFKAAPLQEILDSILLSNGYGYRPVGESLVVMKAEKIGDVSPMFVSATLPLRDASSPDILPAVRLLGSPQGKAQVIPSANTILVLDYPDRVQAIRDFVQRLNSSTADGQADSNAAADDDRMDVLHYHPQFVMPASLADTVENLLSADGRLSVIESEKQLVVVDHVANLKIIHKVLIELDIPRPQVRVTALIYDISLQDAQDIGINWNSAFEGRFDGTTPQNLAALDSLMQVPAAAGSPASAMTFATLNQNFDLKVVIRALSTKKDSRLLADPNIMAMDNESIEISSVTEIPYQQLTQTQQGGNIGTTAFREAGVKLTVTPHVSEDGTVAMYVNPEFSLLTGYTEGDQPQPIIDRRSASTVVRVLNEQTVVIGGLRHRADNGEETGIPYLKDIPYVGFLFRNRKRSVRESELVIFLTPHIVSPIDCMKPRDQAALNTGNCNLDMIPPGDGCPTCVPEPGQPEPAPEVLPPPDDPASLSPDGAYRRPVPPPQRNITNKADPQLAARTLPPTVAIGPVKRLPPISLQREEVASQPRSPHSSDPKQDVDLPNKMFRF